MTSLRAATLALALLAAGIPAATGAAPADRGGARGSAARPDAAPLAGLYRMKGEGRVSARPLVDRAVPIFADAHLSEGREPQQLRLRVVMQGHACDLQARVREGGAFEVPAGQRCVVVLDGPDARGRIEAKLRIGSGQVRGRILSLALDWELDGTLSLRVGGADLLGNLALPWTPEAPVQGEARGRAEGWRDESRAAER